MLLILPVHKNAMLPGLPLRKTKNGNQHWIYEWRTQINNPANFDMM